MAELEFEPEAIDVIAQEAIKRKTGARALRSIVEEIMLDEYVKTVTLEALTMLEIYDDLGKDVLAVPFSKGRKTEKEKFAGALETKLSLFNLPSARAISLSIRSISANKRAFSFSISTSSPRGT